MCLSSLLGNKLLSNNVHLYISSLSLVLHVQRVIRAWGRCFPWISLTFQIKAAALPHTRTRFIGVTGLHCCTFLSSHYSHKLAGSPDGKKKSTCGKVAARPRFWRLRILRCRIMTYGIKTSTSRPIVRAHYSKKRQGLWNIQKAEQITSLRLTVPRPIICHPVSRQTPKLV